MFKFNINRIKYGRWDIHDNYEIKELLANMDSCGSHFCSKPINYSKNIEKVAKKN